MMLFARHLREPGAARLDFTCLPAQNNEQAADHANREQAHGLQDTPDAEGVPAELDGLFDGLGLSVRLFGRRVQKSGEFLSGLKDRGLPRWNR